jgi:hypothetical protein
MTRPHSPDLRAKTLALMMNPPRPHVEQPRGHREWSLPLAERKAR